MWKRLVVAALALGGLAACDRSAVTPFEVPQAAVQSRAAAAGTVVEIKFREALEVRPDAQQRLRSDRGASLAALQAVLDRHGARDLRPLLSVPADRVARLVAAARSRSAGAVPDMASWHRLVLPRDAQVEAALAELRGRPEVEHAYVAPEPAPPPVTPDFTSYQANYFGAAPSGTENVYARALAGGRGAGVVLTDLEYDWYFGHEDLGLSSSILVTGQPYTYYGSGHGTATLGVLVGRDNGIGITGGAPDATIRVASPFYNGSYNPADAITQAAASMAAGDVLLLEQQTFGPVADPEYIPLEWILSVYDAIRLATGAGIMVVEAAGNGGRNLDSPVYGGRFDRSQFDSRAIIVGAGDGTNARLGFSTYGSRVDVQAHGTTVATTGYGGLWGTSLNDYYTYFSGTSSASAIVAAAATTLQGYQKHRARAVLTPLEMSSLFKSTGSAQTGNTAEQIGPKPNLRAAIAQLDAATHRTALHRLFMASTNDHMYSQNPAEGAQSAPGYTLEHYDYFYLESAPTGGHVPLYRCVRTLTSPSGDHFLSTDSGCEGAVVVGLTGYIATWQLSGTAPLYRQYNGLLDDTFYTVSLSEAQYAASNYNYSTPVVTGYVHLTP